MSYSKAELQQKVEDLGPWHHCHHFPYGIRTGDGDCDPKHEKLRMLTAHGAFQRPAYLKVLDVGANSGLIAMWFVDNKRSHVVAVEAGPKYYYQLELAVKVKNYSTNIIPINRDIRQPFFLEGHKGFDLVICLSVLHHIGEEFRQNIVNQCYDAMLPGAEIVIQTKDDIDIPALMTKAGFQDIKTICDWPAPHGKRAWGALKDPMKL